MGFKGVLIARACFPDEMFLYVTVYIHLTCGSLELFLIQAPSLVMFTERKYKLKFYALHNYILGKINLAIFDVTYIFDHLRESLEFIFYFK